MRQLKFSACGLAAIVLWLGFFPSANAADPAIERGKYLVAVGGCSDCHTPGHFFGKPDMSRQLGGSEVGFEVPGLGVFYGPNLTKDKETGLGGWTDAQIAAALTKGVRPDGRKLAAVMPWQSLAVLTPADVGAIIAYLKSLPPVRNKVPGPFGPLEPATSFVMKIVPPETRGAEVGGSLAARWCMGCHVIERGAQADPAARAPAFVTIAARPGTTAESLDRFLSTGHTRMPDFALSPYQRSLLIAYLLSLR